MSDPTERWPFEGLIPLSYDLIMADPNWKFKNWSAAGEGKNPSAHYHCDDLEVIRQWPVHQLARRDCVLWLWATHPMLPQAISVMEAWGFTFKTSGVWVKRTVKGKLGFGTGYCLRSASEPFLIGTVGKPTFSKSVRTVVEGLLRENSRKPDEAYAAAEKLVPGALRRADLFSRENRPGWEAWGDEAGMFDLHEKEKADELDTGTSGSTAQARGGGEERQADRRGAGRCEPERGDRQVQSIEREAGRRPSPQIATCDEGPSLFSLQSCPVGAEV